MDVSKARSSPTQKSRGPLRWLPKPKGRRLDLSPRRLGFPFLPPFSLLSGRCRCSASAALFSSCQLPLPPTLQVVWTRRRGHVRLDPPRLPRRVLRLRPAQAGRPLTPPKICFSPSISNEPHNRKRRPFPLFCHLRVLR